MTRIALLPALILLSGGAALAQADVAGGAHEGMTMLVLFLGIAGIIGVFVIRWSQSTGDEDDSA